MPVGLVAPLPPWAEAGGGAVRWKVETAGYFRITCRRCLCFFHVFSKYIFNIFVEENSAIIQLLIFVSASFPIK